MFVRIADSDSSPHDKNDHDEGEMTMKFDRYDRQSVSTITPQASGALRRCLMLTLTSTDIIQGRL